MVRSSPGPSRPASAGHQPRPGLPRGFPARDSPVLRARIADPPPSAARKGQPHPFRPTRFHTFGCPKRDPSRLSPLGRFLQSLARQCTCRTRRCSTKVTLHGEAGATTGTDGENPQETLPKPLPRAKVEKSAFCTRAAFALSQTVTFSSPALSNSLRDAAATMPRCPTSAQGRAPCNLYPYHPASSTRCQPFSSSRSSSWASSPPCPSRPDEPALKSIMDGVPVRSLSPHSRPLTRADPCG